MTTLREAAQMALDAYESRMQQIGGCSDGGCVVVKPKGMHTNGGCKCWKNAINMQRLAHAANKLVNTLRDRLSAPEPEPVAWMNRAEHGTYFNMAQQDGWQPLYTAPPQREWQGLTASERIDIINGAIGLIDAICDAEEKLREKNF